MTLLRYALLICPIVFASAVFGLDFAFLPQTERTVSPTLVPATASGARVGSSVGLAGNLLIVGAPNHASGGAVFAYFRNGTTFQTDATLLPSDVAEGDLFGASDSLSNTTAAIGAPGKDGGKGAVYVFVRTNGAWSQEAKITAEDGAPGDTFGLSVAVENDLLFIGAPGRAAGSASGAGGVYVFARTAGVWSRQQTLTARDAAADDRFGCAVAFSGDRAAIGACGRAAGTAKGVGTVFVFSNAGGVWTQETQLKPRGLGEGDQFGFAVDIEGDTIVAGAPYLPIRAHRGAVYIFRRDNSAWQIEETLRPGVQFIQGAFGYSLSLQSNRLLVGMPRLAQIDNIPIVGLNYGVSVVFSRAGMSWTLDAVLAPSPGAEDPENQHGFSVAFDGNTAVCGTPFLSKERGGFTQYATNPPVFSMAASVTPSTVDVLQQVAFTVEASDPNGDGLSYTWIFGDGATASGAQVSHRYSRFGVYTAFVVVSDGLASVQASATVTVNPSTGDIQFLDVSETYAEKFKTFREEGETFSDVVESGKLTVSGDLKLKPGDATAFDANTRFIFILGDFMLEERLGADANYKPGNTEATLSIAEDIGDERPRLVKIATVKLKWDGVVLTYKLSAKTGDFFLSAAGESLFSEPAGTVSREVSGAALMGTTSAGFSKRVDAQIKVTVKKLREEEGDTENLELHAIKVSGKGPVSLDH